ncbi:ATP-binding protein [Shewanella yunxiaonensis]|uniref:ATP-binding protein n=1 Tax=Shewanella yunxiaonensis TaxID=2829809 RepID=A0ABX7YUN9_9GAMM|nr:AAA family ATPase [Shewanella yunxiaonensis]QUN06355.1 ATP-binding protein [Shewanella yunxiaonensis]
MLKRSKSRLWRAQYCHYLASCYGEALICAAFTREGKFSSSMVESMTGEKVERHKQYSLDDVLALIPNEDRAPTASNTVPQNAKFLCQLFGLPLQMQPVVAFVIVMNANLGLRSIADVLLDDDEGVLERVLVAKSGLDSEDIIKQLDKLAKCQLIEEVSFVTPYLMKLPVPLIPILVKQPLTSAEQLMAPLICQSREAQFSLSQFGHVNTDLLANYLSAITKQPTVGVNILLYGKAGTGKTELARTLANSVQRSLLEVQSLRLEEGKLVGAFHSRDPASQRLGYLNLLQGLLSGSSGSLLLVDECESLFVQADEHYTKEGLMRVLEQNPVPAIWITNHAELLEPSFIRRFKLVMEVPVPEESFAYAMSQQLLTSLKVSDEYRLLLAEKPNVTPAMVGNAVHVATTLKLKGTKAEAILDEVIEATLEACGEDAPLPKYQGELVFDDSLVNFKIVKEQATSTEQTAEILASINYAVEQAMPIRVMLSGPPGTGKTAWVHHLAETHGYELMHIKCSDVLSKYVGDSEQNVARLFREADKQQKLMLIDEVDSLLSKRESAHAQYEVQLVNELLSQLECNNMPVFAATNALASIDSAVMRRFDFKLECDYLTSEQRQALYRQVFGIKRLTHVEISTLNTLNQLTPGDFAILARRQRFEPKRDHRATALALLGAENSRKQGKPRIGFIR